MKVLGIVAEYNPFHNGHLYHLEESKRISHSDFTVVVMSGNYVQRGEPAIVDKWTRTQMALESGADLVLELPLIYATSSAEFLPLEQYPSCIIQILLTTYPLAANQAL